MKKKRRVKTAVIDLLKGIWPEDADTKDILDQLGSLGYNQSSIRGALHSLKSSDFIKSTQYGSYAYLVPPARGGGRSRPLQIDFPSAIYNLAFISGVSESDDDQVGTIGFVDVGNQNLFFVMDSGDSMRGTISPGSLVKCRRIESPEEALEKPTPGIYLLKLNQKNIISRLDFIDHDTVEIIPDNNAYEKKTIKISEQDVFTLMAHVVL